MLSYLREQLRPRLPAETVAVLDRALFALRRARIRAIHRAFNLMGLNIAKRADYYSVLPSLVDLERTKARWLKPSTMRGIHIDVPAMKALLAELHQAWYRDYKETVGDYFENQAQAYGPGYPKLDGQLLFYVLRQWKPRRYIEVGSGLSTFHAHKAAARNAEEGKPCRVTCVEPFPSPPLSRLQGIELVRDQVQNVPPQLFNELEAGDVLFIDSSHAFKIDSDVAYIILEIIPNLKKGVYVHVHDVPFPFNIPFPPRTWIFGERWPVYWNEAMALQAFLAFNSAFNVLLSLPMVRHVDEKFLETAFEDYMPLARDENPPSSLWLTRTS